MKLNRIFPILLLIAALVALVLYRIAWREKSFDYYFSIKNRTDQSIVVKEVIFDGAVVSQETLGFRSQAAKYLDVKGHVRSRLPAKEISLKIAGGREGDYFTNCTLKNANSVNRCLLKIEFMPRSSQALCACDDLQKL